MAKKFSSLLLTGFAQGISVLIHPLFLYAYMLLIIAQFSPLFFAQLDPMEKSQLIMLNIIYTTVFPLIAILLMKALGIIPSIHMEERKDRIGPFIAAAVFYSWTFINVRKSELLPDIAVITLLAVLISLYLAFIINLVEKISIHGLGTGGMMAFSVYYFITEPQALVGPFNFFGQASLVNVSVLIPVGIIAFALVAWARLYLNKHTLRQVLLGNLVGILSYMISLAFYS